MSDTVSRDSSNNQTDSGRDLNGRDTAGIRDFFGESDSLHITQRWWFISILTISVLLWAAYLYILLSRHYRLLAPDYATAVATAVNSVAGAFVAALISILIVILVNHANIRRLNSIKQLVPRADILENLFLILNGYEQRYATDKHVMLTFGEVLEAPDGFLAARVQLEISETVKLNGNRLVLEFQTLNRELPDDTTVQRPLLGEGSDEMISIDSTDIESHFGKTHKDLFKGIVHVAVNSQTKKLTPESLETVGALQRRVFDVSQELLTRDVLNVYYVYEYTVEIPGYAFFEAREPTFGFYCKVDYRQVADRMSCYFVETFHSTTHRHDISQNPSGEIVLSTQEWVFPRSAAMFCWYKKQRASSSPARVSAPTAAPHADGPGGSSSSSASNVPATIQSGTALPSGDLAGASGSVPRDQVKSQT